VRGFPTDLRCLCLFVLVYNTCCGVFLFCLHVLVYSTCCGLFLFTCIGVQHMLWLVFVYMYWCTTHVACVCFVCFCLVYHVLPVSPDGLFLIAPSAFGIL
jgi:hypothetical protein